MPSLTAKRRSELLNALLQQSTTPQTGNRTGVEALMRVASQFVNKQHMDKLAEQERLDQQKLTDALVQQGFIGSPGGGASLETQGEAIMGDTGDPFTVTQKQRGTRPGVTGMKPLEEALTQILGLPQGVREQGLGILSARQQMQPKPEKVEWDLKEIKSGDQYETWITRNNLPVERFSTADRMQKLMTGTPADWGTNSQQGSHIIEFGKKLGSIDAWGKTGTEFVGMLRENPGANTVTATLANYGNRLFQEVNALTRQGIYQFDDSFRGTDISKWEDVFSANGLAGANARVKRGFLALAIQGAAAQGMGTGRALSDRDVEQQLQTLGANQSDPEIIANIFSDSYQSMINGVQSEAQNFPYLQKKFDEGEWSINEYDFNASKPKVRTYVPGQGFVDK